MIFTPALNDTGIAYYVMNFDSLLRNDTHRYHNHNWSNIYKYTLL